MTIEEVVLIEGQKHENQLSQLNVQIKQQSQELTESQTEIDRLEQVLLEMRSSKLRMGFTVDEMEKDIQKLQSEKNTLIQTTQRRMCDSSQYLENEDDLDKKENPDPSSPRKRAFLLKEEYRKQVQDLQEELNFATLAVESLKIKVKSQEVEIKCLHEKSTMYENIIQESEGALKDVQ